MYKCYIASGWFNENQAKDLDDIKNVLNEINVPYFSPKDEILCPKDADASMQRNVFNGNLKAIQESEFIIVNTRDKDMGTIFEAGYAYCSKKPIIYYCEGLKGMFNLMLSRSGAAVATSKELLKKHILLLLNDKSYTCEYSGFIE